MRGGRIRTGPSRDLRAVGEHGWIARLLRRVPRGGRTIVGPGDDAAAIRVSAGALLLTTDTLVEGVHFRHGWETPAALGRRALRINVSDLAAMGGRPLAALVAIAAPPRLPVASLDGVMRGLLADARRLGIDLAGGNLAAASQLAITVTLLGLAGSSIATRAGARAGDDVWVTGTLGGAAAAVHARLRGRGARRPPVPVRVAAGRRLARLAHAMIDVSDGLAQDMGHVCRASGVAAELDASRLPIAASCRRLAGPRAAAVAASGGEDYELLVVAPPRRRRALERLRPGLGCRLTRIGRVVSGRPTVRLLGPDGTPVALRRAGFDHFG